MSWDKLPLRAQSCECEFYRSKDVEMLVYQLEFLDEELKEQCYNNDELKETIKNIEAKLKETVKTFNQ
jgi:hypothetical protein